MNESSRFGPVDRKGQSSRAKPRAYVYDGTRDLVQRYYAPGSGRFMSPDPLGLNAAKLQNPGSWNRYAYAYGDPINLIDPTGRTACEDLMFTGKYEACYDPCDPATWENGFVGNVDPSCYADPDPGDGLKQRDPPKKVTPIYCESDTIAAMTTAWTQSGNGKSRVEAGFRVDGSPDPGSYTIVPTPFTNQSMAQTMQITSDTFAIFHVHPDKGDPKPSQNDINIANKYHLDIYTLTSQGLFMYDYADKAVMKLRSGLDWMKPCDQ